LTSFGQSAFVWESDQLDSGAGGLGFCICLFTMRWILGV
jgi:hypothetical protein